LLTIVYRAEISAHLILILLIYFNYAVNSVLSFIAKAIFINSSLGSP
jgi:hypothetical protein